MVLQTSGSGHTQGFLSLGSLATLRFAFSCGLRNVTKEKQVSFDTKSPLVPSLDRCVSYTQEN